MEGGAEVMRALTIGSRTIRVHANQDGTWCWASDDGAYRGPWDGDVVPMAAEPTDSDIIANYARWLKVQEANEREAGRLAAAAEALAKEAERMRRAVQK